MWVVRHYIIKTKDGYVARGVDRVTDKPSQACKYTELRVALGLTRGHFPGYVVPVYRYDRKPPEPQQSLRDEVY